MLHTLKREMLSRVPEDAERFDGQDREPASEAAPGLSISWLITRRFGYSLFTLNPSSTTCQQHFLPNYGARLKMPSETEKFQNDLLESVRQMKSGKAARVTHIQVPQAAEARSKIGLSQPAFARLLGVSPRTVQDWEQGRREPTGAAKMLLRVAVSHPEILLKLQNS
ncbi:helix-turn-helix domain-containing protein [Candidatus Thiodictyon syntrophicum]